MGPLAGIKILEIRGIGPGPYAGMLLADMGADVIVVERASKPSGLSLPTQVDATMRGKRSIALDLKSSEGLATLLRLIEKVDAVFEGFRPGVAERLGFGPDACLGINPSLVYGRVTGWGQTGPLSQVAGHDLNYIALTGALAAIGGKDKPVPPLNLVGDYAGGSLFLVVGMLAAMLQSKSSGKGQVVDAAITDGSASLMTLFHTLSNVGAWNTQRSANLLDGGAHFYDVYETVDGKFISIAPIEPQFYALLIDKAALDKNRFAAQHDVAEWPALKTELEKVFRQRTRDEWCELLEGTDACFAPVLDLNEAPTHPHNQARETYIDIGGAIQPAPAPRFSETPALKPKPAHAEGSDTDAVLAEFGWDNDEIEQLRKNGAIT